MKRLIALFVKKNVARFAAILFFLCCATILHAQNWKAKITSQVEMRTWKLTSKAESEMNPLQGATVKLLQGSTVVSQTSSDGSGNFKVMVPANGDFIIEVSYSGCNTKRFAVSTKGVPEAVGTDDFDPSFDIGGFILSKPFQGIDYSGLEKALVKVVYESGIKNLDDDEPFSHAGLEIVSRISQAEKTLINNFCSTNKAGDAALVKPDCPLAKTLYEKAMTIIPGEQYPVDQLVKVGDCLKSAEVANASKAEAEAKAKELAAAKALENKLATEKALAEKAEKDKLASEKAASDKEKIAAEKLAKENAAAEKAEADKIAKQKASEEKLAKQKEAENKPAKTKTEPEKVTKTKPEPKQKAEPVKATPKVEPKEKETGIITTGTAENGTVEPGNGTVKYKVRNTLGANQYQENVKKGDDYMRMKRYTEAKASYQEALKSKVADAYATRKLAEVEKLLIVK